METNEAMKSALLSQAEEAIEDLLMEVQKIEEGDFQELEQQVLSKMIGLGRRCLQQLLDQQAQKTGSTARREGKCGHRQRLVGWRPRQVETLMGKITLRRAYTRRRKNTRGQRRAMRRKGNLSNGCILNWMASWGACVEGVCP